MLKFRERLPAWERKEELLAAIAKNQVMVRFYIEKFSLVAAIVITDLYV